MSKSDLYIIKYQALLNDDTCTFEESDESSDSSHMDSRGSSCDLSIQSYPHSWSLLNIALLLNCFTVIHKPRHSNIKHLEQECHSVNPAGLWLKGLLVSYFY